MSILCRHKYVLSYNVSYYDEMENKRFHDITLVCEKCHRLKKVVKFVTYEDTSIS